MMVTVTGKQHMPQPMHPLTRWRFDNGRINLTKFARHRRVGISTSYLSLIEAGKRPCPEKLAAKLSTITGIPAGTLMNWSAK